MKLQAMRDAFWDRIYELAKADRDIVIVSADFGAPALDKFRADLPKQYINVGISEQNAILVGTGLALAGKKPIVYAISQFITLRCFEQIRIYPCGMNLPVTILGVGAGACYWESGATHHCIEQLSVMRTLPHLKLINCSDQDMAKAAADFAVDGNGPKYIQLDREKIGPLHHTSFDFKKGYEVIGEMKKHVIITTGNMAEKAVKLQGKMGGFAVIDLYGIPVDSDALLQELAGVTQIITLEENTLAGGLGSYMLELLNDAERNIPVCRLGLNTQQGYDASYQYGSREEICEAYGFGAEVIERTITEQFMK